MQHPPPHDPGSPRKATSTIVAPQAMEPDAPELGFGAFKVTYEVWIQAASDAEAGRTLADHHGPPGRASVRSAEHATDRARPGAEVLSPASTSVARASAPAGEILAVACEASTTYAAAFDSSSMSRALQLLLPSEQTLNQFMAISQMRLLAYKQSHHAVIEYMLTGETATARLVGKLYDEPYRAAHVYQTVHSLWEGLFSRTPEFGIPQPVGYLPELRMLVYLPVEGQFLDEMIPGGPEVHRIVSRAAEWLSVLHGHRLQLDKQFEIGREIESLHRWATLIGQTVPEEADAAAWIVEQLAVRVHALRFETHVLIHKDFYYGHILIDRQLNVIDFDEVRLGDPTFDLAHFCAYLLLLGYRKHLPWVGIVSLQQRFLTSYRRAAGWVLDERFVFFYAYTCIKIAKQLCSMRGPHPRPSGAEQCRQVQFIVDAGVAALRCGIGRL